jgi:hypothetical protein
MPLIAYNLTTSNILLTVVSPSVLLPSARHAGQRGPGVNVTSELRPDLATVDPDQGIVGGLLAADYVTLQVNVGLGNTSYVWTGTVDYLTPGLTITPVSSIYTLVDGTRTFTGVVKGVTPIAPTDLSTKGYIDAKTFKNRVVGMTTAVLGAPGSYTRPTADTILAAAVGAIPVIDTSVTLVNGDRFFLAHGLAGLDNGIWEVTSAGSGGTAYSLTRAPDWASGMHVSGASFVVVGGTVNAGKLIRCTNAVTTDTVNTHAITVATIDAVIDHGSLVGLTDYADHPGFSLIDGTRTFSGVVKGVTPVASTDLSTKGYVDAKGWRAVVQAVTAAAIPGYGRVGDVITETAATGPLGATDGVTLLAGERLLLKNGFSNIDNGIYTVTAVGDGASKFILTRALEMTNGQDASGLTAYSAEGTNNANKVFVCTNVTGTAVVNTDALTFAPLHGSLATSGTHQHDTTQIDDVSRMATTTATTAIDTLRAKAGTRMLDTGLQTVVASGGGLTAALYTLDYSTGNILVGFYLANITVGVNVILVGAGSGALPCYELNGTPGVVAPASNAKELALCAILSLGAITLVGVLGAAVPGAVAVEPTSSQVTEALRLANVAGEVPLLNYDPTCGLIWGRVLFVSDGAGGCVGTYRNVTTYIPLALERAVGTIGY